MDFGRIKRDDRPIELAEWTKVISSTPSLEQMPDRTGTNPFTKEEIVFSGEGNAYYVEDGERVGNASFEGGEILTTGIPRAHCEQIAESLKAKVSEDDRS